MSDLIDRQAAIYALLEKGQKSRRYKIGEIWELNFDEIREALATVPSAEPKQGKWADDGFNLTCSACGAKFDASIMYLLDDDALKYCPNCGVKMEKKWEPN